MIKVLGLALYGPLAASTRYRLLQYKAGLRSYGIELNVQCLMGDEYLSARFAGRRIPLTSLARSLAERMKVLRSVEYDLAIVHCELAPLMPSFFELMLLSRRPFVYDFDDAFYLRYRTGKFRILRPVLGEKFDNMIAAASAVTAGNRVLTEYASSYAGNATWLPTVVDTQRYLPDFNRRGHASFTVGWIGSPSTAPYLDQIAPAVEALAESCAVRFLVIGGRAPVVKGVEVVELPWSESTEIELINQMDVGVMPLLDDEWSRGKCAFKLIQYLACGVPVVASPIGANKEVVTPDCGFLARTPAEWVVALTRLRDEPDLRVSMGQEGRQRIEEQYSLGHNLPILANVINSALETPSAY